MHKRILAVVAVLAALGISAAAASASDGLAEGQYEVTVPGVGTIVLDVTATGLDVTTVPDGYSVDLESDGDETEFSLIDLAGNTVLKVEFEGDELEIEGVTATPGEHVFTVEGVGTITVVIGADGTIESVVAPDGFTVEFDDDEISIVSEDGSLTVKVEVEHGVLEVKFEAEHDDDAEEVVSRSDDDDDDDDADHDEDDDDDDDDDENHDQDDSDDDDDSHDDD